MAKGNGKGKGKTKGKRSPGGWSKPNENETSVEIRKESCVCRNGSCKSNVGHVEKPDILLEIVRKDGAKEKARVR
jgi:hypothetical protein